MTISTFDLKKIFLNFFKQKNHILIPQSSIIATNDSSLMFTNAGMNQFKDIFLGNEIAQYKRATNSQICLRLSGKHNDLDIIGYDLHHHTSFDMLGSWSFGDYFKEKAIEYSWELLTSIYGIEKDRLIVTIFTGNDIINKDNDSYMYWKKYISDQQIAFCNYKSNFWSMTYNGPCGPCSEIHLDLRSNKERKIIQGNKIVNTNNPKIIELWNLVFIQYNKLNDKKFHFLSNNYVDTGMGLERLAMIMQNKNSTYDIDIFQKIIFEINKYTNTIYGENNNVDIAIRIIADHIKSIVLIIYYGQIPGNTGAGYIVRRIIRRAVKYGYSYLNLRNPLLYKLVDIISNIYCEENIKKYQNIIENIIYNEENIFLKNLDAGIYKINKYLKTNNNISGNFAFLLYDTYGLPIDITSIIAREKNIKIDTIGYNHLLLNQKNRSKNITHDKLMQIDNWINIDDSISTNFCGYDTFKCKCKILKYRQYKTNEYHIVLDKTPFYPIQGGQINDKGWLYNNNNAKIEIINVFKENNLILHVSRYLLPINSNCFTAEIDINNRKLISCNHSATHLLNYALTKIINSNIKQYGSYICAQYLRFDFNYHTKITDNQIITIENLINRIINQNIYKKEFITKFCDIKTDNIKYLHNKKYGENVRVIQFDNLSSELCSGTHVNSTYDIKVFKIVSERSIASNIRRIEAITSDEAIKYFNNNINTINKIQQYLKNYDDILSKIKSIVDNKKIIEKKYSVLLDKYCTTIISNIKNNSIYLNKINYYISIIDNILYKNINKIISLIENYQRNSIIILIINQENNCKIFISRNLSNHNLSSKLEFIVDKIIKKYNGILLFKNKYYYCINDIKFNLFNFKCFCLFVQSICFKSKKNI